MKAFYSDHFVLPLPEGHRFPMAKYSMLRNRMAADIQAVQMLEAPAATDGELALAHAPEYVQAVKSGSLNPQAQREIGFPWTPAMAERSVRSVGASVAAARVAMKEGIAGNLAGGTHHASAAQGGGFCVFNDIAVAARVLQMEHFRVSKQTLKVMPLFFQTAERHCLAFEILGLQVWHGRHWQDQFAKAAQTLRAHNVIGQVGSNNGGSTHQQDQQHAQTSAGRLPCIGVRHCARLGQVIDRQT